MFRIDENNFKGYALINDYSTSEICVLNCLYSYITLSYVDTHLNQFKIIHKFCIDIEKILKELKYNPNEIKPFENKYQIYKASSSSLNNSISPICWKTIENKENKNTIKNTELKEKLIKPCKTTIKPTKPIENKCKKIKRKENENNNQLKKKIKSVRFSNDNNTCYFNKNDPSINISKECNKEEEDDFFKDFVLSDDDDDDEILKF